MYSILGEYGTNHKTLIILIFFKASRIACFTIVALKKGMHALAASLNASAS